MASSIGNEPHPDDKYVALGTIDKIFKEKDGDELQQIY